MFSSVRLLSVVLFVGLARVLAQEPNALDQSAGDPVVARVGTQQILTSDVMEEFNRLIPMLYYHRKVPPEQLASTRRKALAQLVEKSLIYQDALARGMAASEEEITAEFRKTLSAAGPEYQDVSAAGFVQLLGQFRPLVVRRILLDKNEARFATSVPKPDAAALQAVYDRLLAADKDSLMPPPEAHLLHIFVAVDPAGGAAEFTKKKARAEEARQQLVAGQPFAEVAKAYSDDAPAAGGDLGVVKRGSFKVRSVDDAAFALAAGELSEVVQSLHGFHLLRCLEHKPRRLYTVDEVRPLLENWFTTEHTKERRRVWLKELRERYTVEILATEFLEPAASGGRTGAGN